MPLLAAAGTETARRAPWQLDASHTHACFAVKHLMISTVKGRFRQVSGTVAFDDLIPALASLHVDIQVASIDTGVEQRDQHLRSADFFDAEHHPLMSFTGRRLEGDPEVAFKLFGDLTIRGVTRKVSFDVAHEGRGPDPWGNDRIGYLATGKIDRRDFGLTWNQLLETGGITVGNDVHITIETEIVRPRTT